MIRLMIMLPEGCQCWKSFEGVARTLQLHGFCQVALVAMH